VKAALLFLGWANKTLICKWNIDVLSIKQFRIENHILRGFGTVPRRGIKMIISRVFVSFQWLWVLDSVHGISSIRGFQGVGNRLQRGIVWAPKRKRDGRRGRPESPTSNSPRLRPWFHPGPQLVRDAVRNGSRAPQWRHTKLEPSLQLDPPSASPARRVEQWCWQFEALWQMHPRSRRVWKCRTGNSLLSPSVELQYREIPQRMATWHQSHASLQPSSSRQKTESALLGHRLWGCWRPILLWQKKNN